MTPVFPREGAAVPFFFVCAGMRRTGGTGVSAHGAETGDAPPIFFLRHQKENAPCTVEKKKCRGPNPSLRSGLGKTGVERVGASVNDSLLPGAPGSLGTERVFPRSWGRGCCFRGWSSNGRPSLSALPASLSAAWEVAEDRFEVGRAAAAGKRRSNRSCTLRRTKAVRRGRRA